MVTCERCYARLRELETHLCIIYRGEVFVFCGVDCMEKFVKFKDWRKR